MIGKLQIYVNRDCLSTKYLPYQCDYGSRFARSTGSSPDPGDAVVAEDAQIPMVDPTQVILVH